MKNLRKVFGIVVVAAIIGFAFFGCEEDTGPSVNVPAAKDLPAAPAGVTSIQNETQAMELIESISGNFAEFGEIFTSHFMEIFYEELEKLGFDFSSEDEPNFSIGFGRSITISGTDQIDFDEENGTIKGNVSVKIVNEQVSNSIVNGNLSANINIKMGEEDFSGSVGGSINGKIIFDEDNFLGSGEIDASLSTTVNNNGNVNLKVNAAASMGLTIFNNTTGMKVVVNISGNINETLVGGEMTDAQAERISKAVKGSLVIYSLDNVQMSEYSFDELLNMINVDEDEDE